MKVKPLAIQYCLFSAGRCVDVGTVKYGTRQGSGTSYGSSVSFSCNSGYGIVGSAQRTCQQSGIWSGQQPRCVREYTCEKELHWFTWLYSIVFGAHLVRLPLQMTARYTLQGRISGLFQLSWKCIKFPDNLSLLFYQNKTKYIFI